MDHCTSCYIGKSLSCDEDAGVFFMASESQLNLMMHDPIMGGEDIALGEEEGDV
jgi:hypothetical protein